MESHKANLDGTKQKLSDLIRTNNKNCNFVGLQALDTNVGTTFFGDENRQLGPLKADEAILLPERNLEQVYLIGTAADIIIVSVFR